MMPVGRHAGALYSLLACRTCRPGRACWLAGPAGPAAPASICLRIVLPPARRERGGQSCATPTRERLNGAGRRRARAPARGVSARHPLRWCASTAATNADKAPAVPAGPASQQALPGLEFRQALQARRCLHARQSLVTRPPDRRGFPDCATLWQPLVCGLQAGGAVPAVWMRRPVRSDGMVCAGLAASVAGGQCAPSALVVLLYVAVSHMALASFASIFSVLD